MMQEKSVIRLLSEQVINKISAGEVVERPASVMKELFENALDADATQIDVEIIHGGRQFISVTDNGCGMNRDQALLSIERHATSKIQSEADIENIRTLGFRGEALASISSVCRFTLITRKKTDLSGTEIRISGGKMLGCEDIGCPAGTRVEVRNLFFNVPARRKFLRTEQTELSHIRQFFLVHAMAHPDIGMNLKVEERMVHRLPAASTMPERISVLYYSGFIEQLLPINYVEDTCKITGYAGLPRTGRKDRQDQYIFVNERPVSAPVVYHALNEVYHSLIGKGRYPAVFLFIELDPSLVDVNVHPTKKEVRFRKPKQLRNAVAAALNEALAFQSEKESSSTAAQQPAEKKSVPPPAAERPTFRIQKGMDELLVRPNIVEKRTPKEAPFPSSFQPPQSSVSTPLPSSPWGWCRILGQIGGSYVVLETEDGFVLMEPRAAHERVLFEQFMLAVREHAIHKQGLLTPETVDMLPMDAQIVRTHIEVLREMGFDISAFGRDSFIVEALPVYVQDHPVEPLLTEIVRSLEKSGKKQSTRELLQERIAQAACQTAVRGKDQLSDREMEQLVADLAKTEMPYTSPRGRSTLIYTSFTELDRQFRRD